MPTSSTRRSFLAAAAGALGHAACGRRPAESGGGRKPNILFLFPDQMRAQAMGCMGNPDVRTPRLDRLAAEGLLFENTFANTPVCCPARAVILTGKYAHANGMIANDLRLRESETTLAELLADAGYRTGFVGKWHLDGGPREPGWIPPGERRQGFEFWAANEVSHQHFDTQYFRDDEQPIPIKKFEAEIWADLGIEFLQASRDDERPFFLTIQFGPSHDPYLAPDEYMRMYDPAALTVRPNYRGDDSADELEPNPYRKIPGRKEIAAYYAMVTAVDAQIGRVLDELERLGLAEDTVVVASSDHGDMLGSHGARLKRKPWEESTRVPGIVRYPRAGRRGERTEALLSHVDFAPTLLSLCGVAPSAGMQGADLSAVILGDADSGPDSVYFQIFGPFLAGDVTEGWRGVRTARHMYARRRGEPWVLYDLELDPHELNNLAAEPSAAELRDEMEGLLAQWMERVGDSWEYDWSYPVEDDGRLYKDRTFYTVEEYLEWVGEKP